MSDDLYVSGPVTFDTYYVISEYKASAKGEISLTEGQEVEVIEKNDNGERLLLRDYYLLCRHVCYQKDSISLIMGRSHLPLQLTTSTN